MLMNGNAGALFSVYRAVYVAALIFLILMVFGCMIRAIKGPRVADRIVAINMMGTMVMVIIAVLAFLLQEGGLIDICLIYAMISFLAVIVLTKVYIGIYRERKWKQAKKDTYAEERAAKVEQNAVEEQIAAIKGGNLDGSI